LLPRVLAFWIVGPLDQEAAVARAVPEQPFHHVLAQGVVATADGWVDNRGKVMGKVMDDRGKVMDGILSHD
jgi:hypothetical protein